MPISPTSPEIQKDVVRAKMERVKDASFLRGQLATFVRAEVKSGRMLSPDKWAGNTAQADLEIESIFNQFSDVSKYPEAVEYKKLYGSDKGAFMAVLADILVKTALTAQATKQATKEMSTEISANFVTKTLNDVGDNIERLSREGPTGYAQIALYGFLTYQILRSGWDMLGNFMNPEQYQKGTWARRAANAGNIGIFGSLAYLVYDNMLKSPEERGKGTQRLLGRFGGYNKLSTTALEEQSIANLKKIPAAKDFLDHEATQTYLALADIPVKDVLRAYKSNKIIGEIDPEFLLNSHALTREERALAKRVDPKKLYAIIHSVISVFDPMAKSKGMDTLPYLQEEFVDQAPANDPISFRELTDSAAGPAILALSPLEAKKARAIAEFRSIASGVLADSIKATTVTGVRVVANTLWFPIETLGKVLYNLVTGRWSYANNDYETAKDAVVAAKAAMNP